MATDSALATAPNKRAVVFIPLSYTALRPFRRAPRRTPRPPFGAPNCPPGPAGGKSGFYRPRDEVAGPAQTHLQPHPTAVAVMGGRDAPLAAQQRHDIVISRYLDFEIFRF